MVLSCSVSPYRYHKISFCFAGFTVVLSNGVYCSFKINGSVDSEFQSTIRFLITVILDNDLVNVIFYLLMVC